jgi:hypothetical protein
MARIPLAEPGLDIGGWLREFTSLHVETWAYHYRFFSKTPSYRSLPSSP